MLNILHAKMHCMMTSKTIKIDSHITNHKYYVNIIHAQIFTTFDRNKQDGEQHSLKLPNPFDIEEACPQDFAVEYPIGDVFFFSDARLHLPHDLNVLSFICNLFLLKQT